MSGQEQKEEQTDELSFTDSSGEFDLSLKIEDKKISVCKSVLCVASPVFNKMLKSEFMEKNQTEIELSGKKYEDFVEFLCCIYPDKLQEITEQNAYTILPLFVEYQVKALAKRVHTFLIKLVNKKYKTNAMEIYRHLQLAELYNLEELKDRCISLASNLCLAEMDNGLSIYSVSDKALLQIRHMALQKKEKLAEVNEKDDGYLWTNSQISIRNSTSSYGQTVYLRDLIKQCVQSLGSQCSDISVILRAARLWARYLKDDHICFINIIENLNAKKPRDFQKFEKEELELLPECIKTALKKELRKM